MSENIKTYFAPGKTSKRGKHLLKTGKYMTGEKRQSFIRNVQVSGDSSTMNISGQDSGDIEISSSSLSFEEPPISSTPIKKRKMEDSFEKEDSDFSIIERGFSLSATPPPLIIESYRPIGHEDTSLKNLKGRRIVSIGHLISEARKLENHECVKRPPGYLAFFKEEKIGLNSNVLFKCTACGQCRTISTNPAPSKKENLNFAAVWGTIATGKGYYGLEEFLTTLDIPVLSSKTFWKYHEAVGKTWFQSLTIAMEDAAAKEYAHAVAVGNMDGDIAKIEVCVDGGWSKRSYNHSYTAKSGVAVIIGRHTKRLLHLGVRNKYCSICAIAARKDMTAQPHTCYRNWSGSSPAMEADIIVDGFKNSEALYKLRYTSYVGDGDSSVRKKLEETVPFSQEITKIDCSNHLIKNIKKHLYRFAHENAAQKKIMTDARINSLSKQCRKLVTYHANLPDSSPSLLKRDLCNVVDHIFGQHSSCRQAVCSAAGTTSIHEAYQQLSGTAKARIGTIVGTLATKANSLIKNATSNAAEEFMHIACKFNGGKQVFYGRRNSYNVRCYGAGLAFQYGPEWSNTAWKQYSGRSPGTPRKKMILRRAKSIGRTRQYISRYRHNNYLKLGKTPKCTGRQDYGPNAQQPDLPEEEVAILVERQVARLNVTLEQRDDIEIKTRGQSLNPVWKVERSLRLTASNFGLVCKRRAAPGPLVAAILYQRNLTTDAIEWGKLNEKVALKEYTEKTGLNTNECGLFVSVAPNLGYLAASPDGVVDNDKIVEIKCPYSARYLDPLEAAKSIKQFCSSVVNGQLQLKRGHNYYYQVQGQLYITQRNSCDFVIWTTKGLNIETILLDTEFVNTMLPKLTNFYFKHLGPEIVDSRKKRSMEIREYTKKT